MYKPLAASLLAIAALMSCAAQAASNSIPLPYIRCIEYPAAKSTVQLCTISNRILPYASGPLWDRSVTYRATARSVLTIPRISAKACRGAICTGKTVQQALLRPGQRMELDVAVTLGSKTSARFTALGLPQLAFPPAFGN